MHPALYKGAYEQTEQHFVDIRATAINYWLDELSNKAPATRQLYQIYLNKFLQYINMTADEAIKLREETTNSTDKATRRTFERHFKRYLAQAKQTYASTTLQTIYASICSFFDTHDYPLRLKKKDYPRAHAIGKNRASDEAILKILDENKSTAFHALIHTLKDSGLRISDLRHLKCGIITNDPKTDIIPITIATQKTSIIAKTYIGIEAITALKAYLKHRQNGTRKIAPETITPESPLFKQRSTNQPMSRTTITTIIFNAFKNAGHQEMSAHSLRKRFQTNHEKAGTPQTWIDQMLGHELSGSLGAYSLPTDQELKEAYEKAYKHIRIYPATTYLQPKQNEPEIQEATTLDECKRLIAKGYTFEMDFNGTKIFKAPLRCAPLRQKNQR